jgi:uncharacterized protein (TIGR02118 family)
MFRRLSILVRKPSQTREQFARAWEFHGTLVKQLPGIRAYQQNHVLDAFSRDDADPPFRADGIVELTFDSMDAMKDAFSSEAATPVKADEPNFLGHGTGYVSATPHSPEPAEDGQKLIVIARNHGGASVGDLLQHAVRQLPDLSALIRDDVVSVIARPEMADGPQHADVFLHAYFPGAAEARQAAERLLRNAPEAPFMVVRVRTLTVV